MSCCSLLVFLASVTAPSPAQEEFFEEPREAFRVRSVWDLRFIRTGAARTWLDAGQGKARYGGNGVDSRSLFRVPQASVVFELEPLRDVSVHAHVNVDLEPELPGGRYGWDRLGIIELFGQWTLPIAGELELRTRGGMFFPPISLEHVGEAWTTPFTLTPSAINSWVGEEVRATGAEVTLARVGLENEISGRAAVFWNNDPTGSLLAYRGFALHDRQVGLRNRVPIPQTPSVQSGGVFARQAPFVEPLRELDGRPGYYGALEWDRYRSFRVNGLYFDNRAVPTAFDGDQYGWTTRFANAGAAVFLPADAEVLAQFLDGSTFMGFEDYGAPKMSVGFRSWYVLGTAPVSRRHRITARYDRFRTTDRDSMPAPDGSDEHGSALTFAYVLELFKQKLFAELLRVASHRPARASVGLEPSAVEVQLQLGLRLSF